MWYGIGGAVGGVLLLAVLLCSAYSKSTVEQFLLCTI